MRRHHLPQSESGSDPDDRLSPEKKDHPSLISATPDFPVDYNAVIERIGQIQPLLYDQTRNYTNGAVSYLSPYFSRGIITPVQVRNILLKKYTEDDLYRYTFELAWREYFQNVWWREGEKIFEDLKTDKVSEEKKGIPLTVIEANTSILEINKGIELLYETGYMHNHMRMYIASLCTNIAKTHWLEPARWMYYHLLDADPASNLLSWQWVAGSFSSKKYFFNQENLNKYTGSTQRGTSIDVNYDAFPLAETPTELITCASFNPPDVYLQTDHLVLPDDDEPVYVYTPFHLDPIWRANEKGHRIFWWPEPLMSSLPMSERTIQFILSFAEKIPGIQCFRGDLSKLQTSVNNRKIFTRQHALFKGALNVHLDTDHLMFPNLQHTKGSFMSYWKKCEQILGNSLAR